MGRSFDAKVKFAKIEGKLSEEIARTIATLHEFRNEVYHVGLQHEAILPDLALFYFDTVCSYLKGYRPGSLGWSSNLKIPERAKKYFPRADSHFPADFNDFGNGCGQLATACGHDPAETIAALADHMDEVIADQDTCIGIVADGVYEGQQTTRDLAVLNTQAWRLAFSEEGLSFAKARKWTGNRLQLVEWLAQTYPFRFKRDPIPSWRKQADRLRSAKSPHIALANYQSFMEATSDIRDVITESALQAEAEIDAAIDRARGK